MAAFNLLWFSSGRKTAMLSFSIPLWIRCDPCLPHWGEGNATFSLGWCTRAAQFWLCPAQLTYCSRLQWFVLSRGQGGSCCVRKHNTSQFKVRRAPIGLPWPFPRSSCTCYHSPAATMHLLSFLLAPPHTHTHIHHNFSSCPPLPSFLALPWGSCDTVL